MNFQIKQISPSDKGVRPLIDELNKYQIGLYGIEKCTLETPEQMLANKAFMVGAIREEQIVGMGAVKLLGNYAEIKRMYISHDARGHGLASKILQALEAHVRNNGIESIKLETGNLHFEAMALYEKHGFELCDRFGAYPINDISVYYEKKLC